LVDAETGELHDRLSEGQRKYDLELAQFNVAAELADVASEGGFSDAFDPADIAQDLLDRYDALWSELTSTEVIPQGDKYAIEAKVRRINELGFDVSEITLDEVPGGYRMRFETAVVEADHHRRQLQALTGLDVQEGQARRLLNDVRGYRSYLERKDGKPLSEARAAMRWLQEIFDPVITAVPHELYGKLEPAEIFHQVLEHRWFMSEALDKDIGTTIATQDYVDNVLRKLPEEYHAAADAEAELGQGSA
jgi:hypothetical protein